MMGIFTTSTITARLGLDLPALSGPLAVGCCEDRVADGYGLIRTAESRPAQVVVVHDGSDRGIAEALAYSSLIKLAPVMLALLVEGLGAWAAQFDDADKGGDDGYVSGADLVEWFSGWRQHVRAGLAAAADSRSTGP